MKKYPHVKSGQLTTGEASFYSTKTLDKNAQTSHTDNNTAGAILVIPPDNWYGWVVTLAAFLICFMTDGGLYTFGIFLEDIGESLGVPSTKVAITNSLMSGLNFLLGPIVCALINRYGFRIVTIIGALVMTASFVAGSFLNEINVFLVIVGVVGGAASCLAYTPALIVVGFYFERWRALATAITACGSSIGIIAFPQVFAELLDSLSWRMKFRILGGCYLFCGLMALTFKPITPIMIEEDLIDLSLHSLKSVVNDASHKRGNKKYPTISQASFGGYGRVKRDADDTMSVYSEYMRTHFSTTTITKNSTYTDAQSTRYTVFDSVNDQSEQGIITCCQKCRRRCCGNSYEYHSEVINRPMYRDDIFYTGSVYNLPQYAQRDILTGDVDRKVISIGYHMSVTRLTTLMDLEEQKVCRCCPQAIRRTLSTMMDFSILKLPSFILLVLSGSLTLFALFAAFMFISEKAEEIGIEPSDAIFLLSIIGIANAVGRILSGVVSFFPVIKVTVLIYVTLILCGAGLIGTNFFNSFVGQVVCVVMFGANIAVYFALRIIMLVDLYGLENLTNCFGLILMFQGIASFAGTPLASALKDKTGSYQASFFMLGGSIVLSGILLIPVPILAKRERKMKKIPTSK